MSTRVMLLVAVALAAYVAPAAAQTAAAATPSPQATNGTQAPPLAPQGYDYDPRGRRDPFVSLIRRGSDARSAAPATRPAGLAGLSASEVSLRGTIQGRDGFVAMLHGADNRTYMARVGDRLLDGTVRAITADAVVIRQSVDDPLSRGTEREVRKLLRQPEEAK